MKIDGPLGGGARLEKYAQFLLAGGWAQPGKKAVEVFAERARKRPPV
jgi:hypothetical protein